MRRPAANSMGVGSKAVLLLVPSELLEEIVRVQARLNEPRPSADTPESDAPPSPVGGEVVKVRMYVRAADAPWEPAVAELEVTMPIYLRPHQKPSYAGTDGVVSECFGELLRRHAVARRQVGRR